MSNEQQQSAPTESAKAAPAVRLSSHMETLPAPIKTRVTVLQDLQKQHDELEAKFNEERAALIAKYEKMYEPLYSKRTEIVNGTEVDDVAKAAANEEANAEANEAGIIGVPDFWLIALKTNDVVASQITPKDEGALKYLIDIKSFYLDSPKGFRLEFYFKENPYFKNLKLTKTYHMVEEDEPILERALGTTIEWSPGKNLTQKLMKKKPKKGAKDATVIMKLRPCESFFTFFCPPRIPEDEDEIDQDEVEELQDLFEQDYDVGATIRDKIIPHAVSWYTGEALDGEDFEEDEDEDEDEDDEEDADEDDESDYEDDDNDDNAKTEAQAQSTPVEAGKCASESS